MAKRHGVDKIRVFTDSELLVRSVLDEVNLKSAELQELRLQAQELYGSFADRALEGDELRFGTRFPEARGTWI
jgi:ribonuclease HI